MEDQNDLHDDLRDGVRAVCSQFDDGYWRDLDERHEFPWAFYEAMAAGGWMGVAVPTEFGGGGLGITEASIVLEEVAASGAAMNGCSALHLSMFGMNPVIKHGSSELREAYVPRVVDDRAVAEAAAHHQAHRAADRVGLRDALGVRRHPVGGRLVERAGCDRDALHEVALGEEARARAVAREHRAPGARIAHLP